MKVVFELGTGNPDVERVPEVSPGSKVSLYGYVGGERNEGASGWFEFSGLIDGESQEVGLSPQERQYIVIDVTIPEVSPGIYTINGEGFISPYQTNTQRSLGTDTTQIKVVAEGGQNGDQNRDGGISTSTILLLGGVTAVIGYAMTR